MLPSFLNRFALQQETESRPKETFTIYYDYDQCIQQSLSFIGGPSMVSHSMSMDYVMRGLGPCCLLSVS